jgi:RHS repeat-associated protein
LREEKKGLRVDYSWQMGIPDLVALLDGRFERVTSPSLPAYGVEYARLADGDLIDYARYKTDSTTTVASTQRDYESNRDLIEWVENKVGDTVVSRYDYNKPGGELDELGRRTSVVYTGTAFSQNHLFKWGYNPKSELVWSRSYEGDNPGDLEDEITAEKRLYEYDQIGNRLESTEGTGTATTYGANDVNRYDWVQPPSDPREYLCYDEDGNLKRDGKLSPDCPGADGKYEYKWDAENRLIEVVPVSPSIDPPRNKKVRFVYDYMGRRVRKDVFIYTGAWPADDNPNERWHFVYDGWNVVMVLDGLLGHNNAITRKYTWGLDLSGTINGAGGIGGLLAVDETQGTYQGTYWFFYDGNGNVGQLVKTIKDVNGNITGVESTLAAHYEYDPYGNVITSTGIYAATNPFRFSTKWFDPETGLGNWTFRYYSPRLGRWLSRDPIGEAGGLNLFLSLANSAVCHVDVLGLLSISCCDDEKCSEGDGFYAVVVEQQLRYAYKAGANPDETDGAYTAIRWQGRVHRAYGPALFVAKLVQNAMRSGQPLANPLTVIYSATLWIADVDVEGQLRALEASFAERYGMTLWSRVEAGLCERECCVPGIMVVPKLTKVLGKRVVLPLLLPYPRSRLKWIDWKDRSHWYACKFKRADNPSVSDPDDLIFTSDSPEFIEQKAEECAAQAAQEALE